MKTKGSRIGTVLAAILIARGEVHLGGHLAVPGEQE